MCLGVCVSVWVGIKVRIICLLLIFPPFGDNVSASQQAQRQRIYATVNRRRQKRNEGEQRKDEVAEKTDEPAECSVMLFDENQHISLEKYKALEADNCAKTTLLSLHKRDI